MALYKSVHHHHHHHHYYYYYYYKRKDIDGFISFKKQNVKENRHNINWLTYRLSSIKRQTIKQYTK